MEELLKVNHVTMKFGGLKAINELDMSVSKGEIHGLLGPNGSGKTTCFNVISGVYQPILAGEEYGIEIVSELGIGTSVRLHLPLKLGGNENVSSTARR